MCRVCRRGEGAGISFFGRGSLRRPRTGRPGSILKSFHIHGRHGHLRFRSSPEMTPVSVERRRPTVVLFPAYAGLAACAMMPADGLEGPMASFRWLVPLALVA